jgi:hypothetical protein
MFHDQYINQGCLLDRNNEPITLEITLKNGMSFSRITGTNLLSHADGQTPYLQGQGMCSLARVAVVINSRTTNRTIQEYNVLYHLNENCNLYCRGRPLFHRLRLRCPTSTTVRVPRTINPTDYKYTCLIVLTTS